MEFGVAADAAGAFQFRGDVSPQRPEAEDFDNFTAVGFTETLLSKPTTHLGQC